MLSSSELTRIMVWKYSVMGCPPVSVFENCLWAVLSLGRHPNRIQPGICTARARFHPVKIRAHIVPRKAGQILRLAPPIRRFHRRIKAAVIDPIMGRPDRKDLTRAFFSISSSNPRHPHY
jgi:hypothetical protein